MQTERYGNWLQTYTGVPFYPLDPKPEDINIEDIAHALSNTCRYGGHSSKFISVAQHSCLVSRLVPKGMELWGLLHDASEAYLVDIPRPIKSYLGIYHTLEDICMQAVADRFKLQMPIPNEVKMADDAVLRIERKLFMLEVDACVWFEDDTPVDLPWYKGNYMNINIIPQKPAIAEIRFLERYEKLVVD